MKKWLLIFSAAVLFDSALSIWCLVPPRAIEAYFFDVGEGDSELVSLSGRVKILIDGGRGGSLLPEMGRALGPLRKRIDLIILTHCQLDHLGGLYETINRYEVGAFIYNGCDSALGEWQNIKNELAAHNIPVYKAKAGDAIRYGESEATILSPGSSCSDLKNENERAITFLLKYKGTGFLFMSDAPPDLEKKVARLLTGPVSVLKVSHHGSRFSSVPEFLNKAKPLLSIIEVGKNNYGHPAASTVNKLLEYGRVYRTDLSGTVKVILDDNKIRVLIDKS